MVEKSREIEKSCKFRNIVTILDFWNNCEPLSELFKFQITENYLTIDNHKFVIEKENLYSL